MAVLLQVSLSVCIISNIGGFFNGTAKNGGKGEKSLPPFFLLHRNRYIHNIYIVPSQHPSQIIHLRSCVDRFTVCKRGLVVLDQIHVGIPKAVEKRVDTSANACGRSL